MSANASDVGARFAALAVDSNWSAIDTLEGVPIKDREPCDVLWPNGDVTREVVRLEETTFTVNDHGHPSYCPDRKAYVVVAFRGVETRINFRKSAILLRRVVKDDR